MATSKKSTKETTQEEVSEEVQVTKGLNVSPTMPYYCTWLPGACPEGAKAQAAEGPFTNPPMCPPHDLGHATVVPTYVPPCPTMPQICVPTINPPCPKPADAEAVAQTQTIITCTGIPIVCGAQAQNVGLLSHPPVCPTVPPMCPPRLSAVPMCPTVPPICPGPAQAQTAVTTTVQTIATECHIYSAATCPVTTCCPAHGTQAQPQGTLAATTTVQTIAVCPQTIPPRCTIYGGAQAQAQGPITVTTTVQTMPLCPPTIDPRATCVPPSTICGAQAQTQGTLAVTTTVQTLPLCPPTFDPRATCVPHGGAQAQAQGITLPPSLILLRTACVNQAAQAQFTGGIIHGIEHGVQHATNVAHGVATAVAGCGGGNIPTAGGLCSINPEACIATQVGSAVAHCHAGAQAQVGGLVTNNGLCTQGLYCPPSRAYTCPVGCHPPGAQAQITIVTFGPATSPCVCPPSIGCPTGHGPATVCPPGAAQAQAVGGGTAATVCTRFGCATGVPPMTVCINPGQNLVTAGNHCSGIQTACCPNQVGTGITGTYTCTHITGCPVTTYQARPWPITFDGACTGTGITRAQAQAQGTITGGNHCSGIQTACCATGVPPATVCITAPQAQAVGDTTTATVCTRYGCLLSATPNCIHTGAPPLTVCVNPGQNLVTAGNHCSGIYTACCNAQQGTAATVCTQHGCLLSATPNCIHTGTGCPRPTLLTRLTCPTGNGPATVCVTADAQVTITGGNHCSGIHTGCCLVSAPPNCSGIQTACCPQQANQQCNTVVNCGHTYATVCTMAVGAGCTSPIQGQAQGTITGGNHCSGIQTACCLVSAPPNCSGIQTACCATGVPPATVCPAPGTQPQGIGDTWNNPACPGYTVLGCPPTNHPPATVCVGTGPQPQVATIGQSVIIINCPPTNHPPATVCPATTLICGGGAQAQGITGMLCMTVTTTTVTV